jgi:hypothetical protein
VNDVNARAARVAFLQIVQYFLHAGNALQRPRSASIIAQEDDGYLTAMAIDNFSYEPSYYIKLR